MTTVSLAREAKALRLKESTLRLYLRRGVGCHKTAERIAAVTGIPLKELLYGSKRTVRTEVAEGSPTQTSQDGNPKRRQPQKTFRMP